MNDISSTWNGLDYTILVIIGLSATHGTFRGLVRQVFGVLGIVVGCLAAWTFHESLSETVLEVLPSQPIPRGVIDTIVFILVFSGSAGIISGVGRLLRKAMNLVALGWIDALGGAAYGLIRGTLAALALTACLAMGLRAPSPLVGDSAVLRTVAGWEIAWDGWLPASVYEPLAESLGRHRIHSGIPPTRI